MYTSFNARALGLPLTIEETLEFAAEAGFDGVDLLVRDLVDGGHDPVAVRGRMEELGLRGGAFPLPVDWRGGSESFSRDLKQLPRYAEAARLLGLTRTGTWVMPETAGAETTREATLQLHVERLGAIADVLDRQGVRLGFEVIGVASSRSGCGQPFIHRLEDLDELAGPLRKKCGNLGVLVDAFHLYAAGEQVDSALRWGVENVVWVHVADLPAGASSERAAIRDLDRGLPGEHGAVESRELLELLSRQDYDGPVTAEPMPGCRSLTGKAPRDAIRCVADALRSVWPGPQASEKGS
jgi:sugar phosphate isomerase/epimerase